MTTRKKIAEDVSKIIADSKDASNDISAYVRHEFTAALELSRKTGSSIKETVHSMLDGIGSAVVAANLESDELLQKAADMMSETTHASTEGVLKAAHSTTDAAKGALDAALEHSKGSIAKVEASTKQAVEKSYVDLKEKTRTELNHLEAVSEAIYEYSREKTQGLGEATRPKLKAAAQKSREYLEATEKSAAKHNKELLRHGRIEVAEWLKKMAEKVDPENSGES